MKILKRITQIAIRLAPALTTSLQAQSSGSSGSGSGTGTSTSAGSGSAAESTGSGTSTGASAGSERDEDERRPAGDPQGSSSERASRTRRNKPQTRYSTALRRRLTEEQLNKTKFHLW